MSLISVKDEGVNVKELEIKISPEDFEAAVERAYQQKKENISIPGFRKGKVTRTMVEKMYGEGFFYNDALNDIADSYYYEAVKEADIKPVDRPEMDVSEISKENGVVLKAKVTVYPQIKLGEYKGLKATKKTAEATDEDVNRELEAQRQRAALLETADRKSKLGDTLVFDFEGFVDGVAFAGGKAENYSLKLGSGQFIPGFEEQLVDRAAGEECDVVVTFPDDYQEKSLAGKESVFKCKIHEVKETILPELDDEFAKDISEFETLEEYKADLKKKIEESMQQNYDSEFEGELIDGLIDIMEGEIPQVMFDSQLNNIASDYDQRMRMQGMDLETYLKIQGMDMDSFAKMFMPQAERQVKTRLALEKIVELEKFVVGEDEVENEYNEIAKKYNMEVDKVKQAINQDELIKDIAITKAIEFVKNHAVLVEEKKTEAKKTAKKPAAKKAKPEAEEKTKEKAE